jgi:hypothetical protein
MALPGEHDVGLATYSLMMLCGGGAVLFFLNLVLKQVGVVAASKFAQQGDVQKAIQPVVARYVKPLFDHIFGASATSSGLSFKLEHLILMGILMAVIGLWRSVHIQTEVLKAAAAKEKKKSSDKGEKNAGASKQD